MDLRGAPNHHYFCRINTGIREFVADADGIIHAVEQPFIEPILRHFMPTDAGSEKANWRIAMTGTPFEKYYASGIALANATAYAADEDGRLVDIKTTTRGVALDHVHAMLNAGCRIADPELVA